MATEKGVWDNQDVKDKITVSEWEYSSNLHSAWSWGSNNHGPSAQNNQTIYSSPVQIPGTWGDVAVHGISYNYSSIGFKYG